MVKLMEFWNEYGAMLTNFAIVVAGSLLTYLFNRFLKGTGNRVLNYSTQVISKMFGGDSNLSDVNEYIKELPFVQEFRKYANDLNIANELRLIDLKRKITSPNLSEIEKLVFENEYKVLRKLIGNKLTLETSEILDRIDELSE